MAKKRVKLRYSKLWYVYALIDQASKRPFYVGITSNWALRQRSHLDNPCVQALCRPMPTMECIRVVESEEIARRIERHLIRKLGGLVNITHAAAEQVKNQAVSQKCITLEPIAPTYQLVVHDVP